MQKSLFEQLLMLIGAEEEIGLDSQIAQFPELGHNGFTTKYNPLYKLLGNHLTKDFFYVNGSILFFQLH